jgi:hypothetical protein
MKSNKLRKQNAIDMKEAHDKLTKAQKLAKLDARLGVGVGAKKERSKLA